MVVHAYNPRKAEVEAGVSGVQSIYQVRIGAPLAKTKTKAGRCGVTPALRMLRQEDEKFEASMSYIVRK